MAKKREKLGSTIFKMPKNSILNPYEGQGNWDQNAWNEAKRQVTQEEQVKQEQEKQRNFMLEQSKIHNARREQIIANQKKKLGLDVKVGEKK